MQNQKMLRTALKGNAIFSILSGLTLILFNTFFQTLFATDLSLWILGLALLFFAGQVLYTALRKSLVKKEVVSIIVMDILWVIGSVVLLIAVPGIPTMGKWIVILVALFIADFAVFQYLGWKKVIQ